MGSLRWVLVFFLTLFSYVPFFPNQCLSNILETFLRCSYGTDAKGPNHNDWVPIGTLLVLVYISSSLFSVLWLHTLHCLLANLIFSLRIKFHELLLGPYFGCWGSLFHKKVGSLFQSLGVPISFCIVHGCLFVSFIKSSTL